MTDFGAVGDGTTDDGPAFQSAFSALLAAGGGRLIVPRGSYRIASPAAINGGGTNDIHVQISGFGTVSRILVDTPSTNMWTWSNLGRIEIERLAFIGYDQGRFVDAQSAIIFSSVREGMIHHSSFYGVGVNISLVQWLRSGAYFQSNGVYGCAVAQLTGLLYALGWIEFQISDSQFLDYGNLGGVYYSKTPNGLYAWIACDDPASQVSGSIASHTVSVQRCGFDEGGSHAIQVRSGSGKGVFDRVLISDCNFLVGVLSSVYVEYAKDVSLERLSFSSNNWPRAAMDLLRLYGRARISNCTHSPGTQGTGTLAYRFDVPTPTQPSKSITIDDCEYNSIVRGDGSLLGDSATVTGSADGVRWRLRRTDGAIVANSLVRPGTTGHVAQLAAGDPPSLASGVALDAAAAAGALIRVVEQSGQQVAIESDGTTPINSGDAVAPSTYSPGRVTAVTSGGAVGRAFSSTDGTADSLVDVIWSKEQL